ncbi:MAG: hypothetical protein DYH12_11960, partial [Sorangiineae bacterium PRO1]|nr:hypothetical protein [Sorangiineae bacterium PRO1]
RARRDREREDSAAPPGLDTLPPAPPEPSEAASLDTFAPPEDEDPRPAADPRDLELAERLENAVRANPADEVLAFELADVLWRLGRDHELFALLSARHETIAGHRRHDLEARLAQVLTRLSTRATREGRVREAQVYRARLAELSGG